MLKPFSNYSWSQTPQRTTATATAGPTTTTTTAAAAATAAAPDDDTATSSDQHQAGARMSDRRSDAGTDAARLSVERI